MTIAITGATGHLGRHVIEKLRDRGATDDIVALARSPKKGADLGVPVREADYEELDSLRAALQGVDTLLLISSSEVGKRAAQHHNVLTAAKENGVRRVVYTSLLRTDTSPLSLAGEHLTTEKEIQESGLDYTILRNGWYIENHTENIGSVLEHGVVLGSAGQGRFSSATREDYAEAAAVVLTQDGHDGKTYELSGDEAFTLDDYAAEISRQTGRDITFKNLPESEYAAILTQAQLPPPIAQAIASWDAEASNGALYDEGHTLSKLIGRPTTPLKDAVRSALSK